MSTHTFHPVSVSPGVRAPPSASTHTHTHTSVSVSPISCTHTCICIHTHTCQCHLVYAHLHLCLYTHTHTHTCQCGSSCAHTSIFTDTRTSVGVSPVHTPPSVSKHTHRSPDTHLSVSHLMYTHLHMHLTHTYTHTPLHNETPCPSLMRYPMGII